MRRALRHTFDGVVATAITAVLLAAALPRSAQAQAPAPARPAPATPAAPANPAASNRGGAGEGTVENDPIRCWNRSSAGAVRIGETFTVSLTCAVLESELVKVLPDESKLGVTVVQMTPFEVAGGDHPADIRTGGRRFIQYHYNVRMINADTIGTDVPVPLQQVTYRINSTIAGNQQQQGREMSYVLPVLWVKVLSTVPQDATDIRDTSDASFSRIERIGFRAGVLEIIGTTLVVLGGIMTLLGLIAIARRATRRVKGPQQRLLGPFSTMGVAVRELKRAQNDGSGGWDDTAINRAAAALRIAAAGALEKPVSQRFVDRDTEAGEGRFVSSRFGLGRKIAVSASVTGQDLSRAISRLPEGSAKQQLLAQLKESLDALAAARYSRPGVDRSGLDPAVDRAVGLARQVRMKYIWPLPWFRRLFARTSSMPLKAQQKA